ncbi:MAG: SusC/RagA family TonB-linked outer membrane protein [Ferruginibacter sp.]|nr:SusC/RagA family TonB-linked outer membrane protein [Ferruginibacter sp.]
MCTKAGNGVIVITTRKGRFNQAIRVQVNASVSVGEKPDLFYLPEINAADYVDVEKMLYDKGFYKNAINSSSKPPLSPVVELLVQKTNGSISAAEADSRINALKTHDMRDDYNRWLYTTPLNQQYNVNMQCGDQRVAWSFSAGADKNLDELKNSYGRVSLRNNTVFRITDRLQLSTGIYYTQSRTRAGKPGYGQFGTANGSLPIYTRLADDAGQPLGVMKDFRQAYLDTLGGGRLLNWNYYPLNDYQSVDNRNVLQDVTGNLGLQFKLVKGLSADVQYQYERQTNAGRILNNEHSYFARNLVNGFSQLNAQGKVVYIVPRGSILDNSSDVLEAHNLRGVLNYNYAWKSSSLTAIAGAEIRNSHTNGNSMRVYGYNDQLLTFSNVDFVNYYTHIITGFDNTIPNTNGFSDKLYRYMSYFGNAAYTFRQKYIVSLSGRKDGSNLFGVDYNQKSIPLWSAGASWDISKEGFYHISALPYLRLRSTYGVSGNADPTRSAVTTIIYGVNSIYTQSPVARIDQYANPSLRWEKVKQFNIGLDFRNRSNRLSGSIEFFRKKGIDLFGTSPIDYTGAGVPSLVKNTASIKGYGWDLAVNSINVQRAIEWTTNFNLSINREIVLDYYLAAPQIVNFTNGGSNISAIKGRPVYALYGYRWASLDPANGDPQGFLDGHASKNYAAIMGSTNLADLVYKGSALPVVSGNMGNTVRYKSLSLSVRLLYKLGYWFKRNSIHYGNLFGSRQGNSDFALRWHQPGDEAFTDVPSMVYPAISNRDNFYRGSEVLIERGDHVRLQYVTLSYEPGIRLLPFRSLQVYINANNLGIVWKANDKGIDPDYYNGLVVARNFVFGVRVGF